jgi:hypothetical protein
MAPDFLDDPEPGLLEKIFCGGGILSQPDEKSVEAMLVVRHYGFKSAGIPAFEAGKCSVRDAWQVKVHGGRKDHTEVYTVVTPKRTHGS